MKYRVKDCDNNDIIAMCYADNPTQAERIMKQAINYYLDMCDGECFWIMEHYDDNDKRWKIVWHLAED